MMADWTATFGYMNPEFTDDLMVECITKARQAATLTTDRPVRNIAVIPFHADCPQTFAKLSEYHHTQKILIIFQPSTFSFWPYQVHLGTRSPFGFTPYKRTLAIVLWENQLAREKFPLSHTHQGELASWCAENLKLTSKSPPLFHNSLSHASNLFQNPPTTKIPLHPAWLKIVSNTLRQSTNQSAPDISLLTSAAGLQSAQIIDIMAATIPNPATVATAHKKLTLDVIQLFYDAWTESKSIHPIPKSHLLSLKATRLFRTRNPKRPSPDNPTGEHIQNFKIAKTTLSHATRDTRPAIYAARNNTHSHSSPM